MKEQKLGGFSSPMGAGTHLCRCMQPSTCINTQHVTSTCTSWFRWTYFFPRRNGWENELIGYSTKQSKRTRNKRFLRENIATIVHSDVHWMSATKYTTFPLNSSKHEPLFIENKSLCNIGCWCGKWSSRSFLQTFPSENFSKKLWINPSLFLPMLLLKIH